MSNRVPNINSSIYTDCNPENIVSAKKGSWFFRRDNNFYINHSGNNGGTWIQLLYNTVILPRPNPNKLILYSHRFQLWEKTTDGFDAPWTRGDRVKSILPKTGWKSISQEDAFSSIPASDPFGWIFPPPSSSYDLSAVGGNKSYDNDFYYYKTSEIWYRNPLAIFDFPGNYSAENPIWSNDVPFVFVPRYLPVPSSSYDQSSVKSGNQTYDADFFYVKSAVWKRAPLITYSPPKLTLF